MLNLNIHDRYNAVIETINATAEISEDEQGIQAQYIALLLISSGIPIKPSEAPEMYQEYMQRRNQELRASLEKCNILEKVMLQMKALLSAPIKCTEMNESVIEKIEVFFDPQKAPSDKYV